MAAGLPRAGPRVGAGDHAEDDAALVAGAEIAGIRMDQIAAQPRKRLLCLGQIQLSRAEQRLLRALVENRGHAVSRAALVDRVWTDGGDYVDENALTVTVRRLRAKLEDDPAAPVYLKTVYGIGYIWAVTG